MIPGCACKLAHCVCVCVTPCSLLALPSEGRKEGGSSKFTSSSLSLRLLSISQPELEASPSPRQTRLPVSPIADWRGGDWSRFVCVLMSYCPYKTIHCLSAWSSPVQSCCISSFYDVSDRLNPIMMTRLPTVQHSSRKEKSFPRVHLPHTQSCFLMVQTTNGITHHSLTTHQSCSAWSSPKPLGVGKEKGKGRGVGQKK